MLLLLVRLSVFATLNFKPQPLSLNPSTLIRHYRVATREVRQAGGRAPTSFRVDHAAPGQTLGALRDVRSKQGMTSKDTYRLAKRWTGILHNCHVSVRIKTLPLPNSLYQPM